MACIFCLPAGGSSVEIIAVFAADSYFVLYMCTRSFKSMMFMCTSMCAVHLCAWVYLRVYVSGTGVAEQRVCNEKEIWSPFRHEEKEQNKNEQNTL